MLDRLDTAEKYPGTSPTAGGIDLHSVIGFLWRRWRLIAAGTALALLVAAFNLARATPLYTATAVLLIEPNRERPFGKSAILPDDAPEGSMLENAITLINSSALLRRVVANENLVSDPEFGVAPAGAGGSTLLAATRSLFSRSTTREPPPKKKVAEGRISTTIEGASKETLATTENIKSRLAVSRLPGQGAVLNISFVSVDPAKAARLANAVADAYVVDKLDARFEAAKRATTWLNDRLVELRKNVRDAEGAVARFRAENNLPNVAPGMTLTQEQLAQLNGRLVAVRAETAEKRARLDLLQKVEANGGNVSALPDAMNSGVIADLRRQENDLSRQEADLLARYSPVHPAVVNLRAQISDIRRASAAELKRLTSAIRNEYELATARQAAAEKTLREVTGQADLDNEKAITLRELERDAAVNKSLFEDFLQRAHIAQEQSTFEVRDARVITAALPPTAPSSPKTMIVFATALGIGLVGGAAAAFLVEMLNAGFTTPRQIEEMLELPLLASISKMEESELAVEGEKVSIPRYLQIKPLSRFSEAIHSLRSAIQMSDVDNPPKVLQATSTTPGEGKTTISLATGASAAHSGQKVVIVDCDLRHPSIAKFFGLDQAAGLVDYLAGEAELAAAVHYDEKLRLWFMPAGAKTQNPHDLLASERMRALVATLRRDYDLVIIDSPPAGLVIDPQIISNLVEKIIFVVRWGATPREMVSHSIGRLSNRKKIAGVVYNHVIDKQARKYGKYHYSYYYQGRYYKDYYTE
ncbi:GumC family protein [Methylocystis heyeri]|uniref:non-specific protein-tyrosine kinase n=1 Tax=Methylocystis heyeri TaxID=391905 RepID=A0A6B8KE17_9HYPH|nr:polysaccharide biosynthesis tyrosine autokinase [Methylocystis heyeri]QGM45251.1 polysaccharide biosynthesis tyrosine autokinase [Methylocystis heyeri]